MSIQFSFAPTQNDYHPTNLEIKKYKADGSLSDNFKNKCRDFLELMNKEIQDFQTKYNSGTLQQYQEIIRFYDSKEQFYELTPFYNVEPSISFAGISFKSSEQLICFAKTLYSNDYSTSFKILIQSKSYYAHNYAKNVEECLNWNNIYYPIVFTANNYKFKNEALKQMLLGTRGKHLIYDSKYDNKLGIGKDGNGQNILGIMLMMIRDIVNSN